MVAYQPFVSIAHGVRIGVAILTYKGSVSFEITGEYDTVPDQASPVDHGAEVTLASGPTPIPAR